MTRYSLRQSKLSLAWSVCGLSDAQLASATVTGSEGRGRRVRRHVDSLNLSYHDHCVARVQAVTRSLLVG